MRQYEESVPRPGVRTMGFDRAFKKALDGKAHRERAQPVARAKLGLLEKKKDYIQRARDYHRKQDTLKALRIRASTRNPDEFNFGMIRARLIVSMRHIASNWSAGRETRQGLDGKEQSYTGGHVEADEDSGCLLHLHADQGQSTGKQWYVVPRNILSVEAERGRGGTARAGSATERTHCEESHFLCRGRRRKGRARHQAD